MPLKRFITDRAHARSGRICIRPHSPASSVTRRDKPHDQTEPLMKTQNCADQRLQPRSRQQAKACRSTGAQNPWIPQTLRFTHIHNEKQPTNIATGMNPLHRRCRTLINP